MFQKLFKLLRSSFNVRIGQIFFWFNYLVCSILRHIFKRNFFWIIILRELLSNNSIFRINFKFSWAALVNYVSERVDHASFMTNGGLNWNKDIHLNLLVFYKFYEEGSGRVTLDSQIKERNLSIFIYCWSNLNIRIDGIEIIQIIAHYFLEKGSEAAVNTSIPK